MLIDNDNSTSQSPIHMWSWVSLWSSFSITYLWKMMDLIKKKNPLRTKLVMNHGQPGGKLRTEKAAPKPSEEKLILKYWVCPPALKQMRCKDWLRHKKAPWTICDWRKLGTESKSSMHLAHQKEDMNCYLPSWDQEPALPREKCTWQDPQIFQERHNKNPQLEEKAGKIIAWH